jgi:hypothetical protein
LIFKQWRGAAGGGGGGGGGYTINAIEFGGGEKMESTSMSEQGGDTKGLISFNFYQPSAWQPTYIIMAGYNSTWGETWGIRQASSNRVSFFVYDTAGANALSWVSTETDFAANTWYTMIFSFDISSGTPGLQVARRPSGGSWSLLNTSGVSITSGNPIRQTSRGAVGDTNNIYFADIYASLNRKLDLSVGANRDLFLPTADKGATGNTPTGTQPQWFFSGATGSWATNKGTAGGMTVTGGSISTAPSTPT